MFSVDQIYKNNGKRKEFNGKRSRDVLKLSTYIVHRKSSLGFSIIAEFKRKSPSGFRNVDNPEIEGYVNSMVGMGVSGISILTEPEYFGGSYDDIRRIANIGIPVLDKDFIDRKAMVDSAYNAGADCILLIADFLGKESIEYLSGYAADLGMEALVEFHDLDALSRIPEKEEIIIGYNRRNLRTLSMDGRENQIIRELESRGNLLVLESGLDPFNMSRENVRAFDSFLIGEGLLRKKREENVA